MTTLAVWLIPSGLSALAEVRGRVTDADTGASLSGALVEVDPDIATPGDEFTTLTGPWGFYFVPDFPAGLYQVTASHPGYTPETKEMTFSDGDLLMEDFALEPLIPGQTLITIYAHVVDTKSSLELSDVPVRIRRFNSEGASGPAETLVDVTDEFGMIEFNGLPSGWYDFRFNSTENDTEMARPFWESMAIGRRILNTTHSANARLMPIGQDVTFMVEGLDPAMPDSEKGLSGVYVTLTGIRPDFEDYLPLGFDPFTDLLSDYVIPILPPRMGVTDKEGKVVFKNLPAIPFMVQAQKYGYKRWEEPYLPHPDSGEFVSPKMLFLDLEPTLLKVALESFYPDFLFPDGVPVVLLGLKGTNTEGIRREAPAFFIPFGPPPIIPLPVATFEVLLPGRYLVSV
ncbi:MAG: carboxypeptidase-like regulatory domain-containing protein, partial [Verrucomicrobia bacterium]|nr:carboxypeptidase-like regulatory domain-containing protein [Verrucomicrobiota bacterium]